MSSRPELKLDWCSYQAAKYAVEHWHYSKTMPVGKMAKMGVWEDSRFVGVIIFGLGGGGAGDGRRYGLARNFEVVELERVALTNHCSPVSQLISVAIRMLKIHAPKLRMVISYADTAQAHLGIIYQAGNWVYVGETARDWFAVGPDGKKYHSRIARAHVQFGIRKVVNVSAMERYPTQPKHRYLYPLDDEMRQCILPLAKPYPKRVKDSSEPSAIHAGEGGAAPTHTLQHLFPINQRLQNLIKP